jgi:GNAT superfamily N-acetyltransferase
MTPFVRLAEPRDAQGAIVALRRSIVELCRPDHHDDPRTLAEWLGNKTSENFLSWLDSAHHYCIIAEDESVVCGVGLIKDDGDIQLCYVLPGMQHRGIGAGIVRELETRARSWGLKTVSLNSTATARSFYERIGYVPAREAECRFGGMRCYPYVKTLAP